MERIGLLIMKYFIATKTMTCHFETGSRRFKEDELVTERELKYYGIKLSPDTIRVVVNEKDESLILTAVDYPPKAIYKSYGRRYAKGYRHGISIRILNLWRYLNNNRDTYGHF